MNTTVLIIPGYGNSGPGHWQSEWEAVNPSFVRIAMKDWDRPNLGDWIATIDSTLESLGPDTVIAAHSLGCLAFAHWAGSTTSATSKIKGALLVAVPDPHGPSFPKQATGFDEVPLAPMPFPTVVVSSSDDPYADESHARRCAAAWGGKHLSIGARGHINAESGLGGWEEGRRLLDSLYLDTAKKDDAPQL